MAMQELRPASKKYTIIGNQAEKFRQISTSPGVIVRGVIVTGASTSAVGRVIDSREGAGHAGPGHLNYIVAANGGESTVSSIQHVMEQGLYIELEQGLNTSAEMTVFYDE